MPISYCHLADGWLAIYAQDMASENWYPIDGWENEYMVSDHGRILSQRRIDVIGRRIGGRILSAAPNGQGYPKVALVSADFRDEKKVHRIVAETFLPREEGRDEVIHLDFDYRNNHVNNLMWVTRSEARRYCFAFGFLKATEKQREWAREMARRYRAISIESHSMPVTVKGERYSSIRAAARALGMCRKRLRKMVK